MSKNDFIKESLKSRIKWPFKDMQMYSVKVYVERTGFKRGHFKTIVRTNQYEDVKPAVEAYLENWCKETGGRIEKMEIRKLECDFFIPNTKLYV